MGHNVGSAAERAVSKSVKAEAVKARTDEQVFRDMERNLDASLSVPPLDIRLLLKRYRGLKKHADAIEREEGLNQAAETEAAYERGRAALEEAKPLIVELSKNPVFVEALGAEGKQIDLEALGILDAPAVAQIQDETIVEVANGSQEETPSGTEERSGSGSVGEAQS